MSAARLPQVRNRSVGESGLEDDPWFEAHPYPNPQRLRSIRMVDLWFHDIESLEAVTQDEQTKRLCLRMAAMSQAGTLAPFIASLSRDQDLDEGTKGTLAEIASDANFLLALEDYVRRTRIAH